MSTKIKNNNSKRSKNDKNGEENSDIEMSKDKTKKESASGKDDSGSGSESDSSSDSSSHSSDSSSSTGTPSAASAHEKEKINKISEKSKISSKPQDKKNNVSGSRKREKGGGGIDNRSKWDSPEQRRRSRSPRRERSQDRGRYEERGKYSKRARSGSRDRYQSRERRNFHDDRNRNDNREDDRRGYRNRQRPEHARDVERRDRANNDMGEKRSGDGWRNSRNDNNYEGTRSNQRRDRSRSPRRDRRSPKQQHERRKRRSRSGEQDYQWGKKTDDDKKHTKKTEEKEQPNFGLSGALTEDTNKVNGVVVKYAEPVEARRPKRRWRLYPFKGETALPVLHIHRQSCFLVGRDRKVVDLAVDHPSCSKQHAALQYRLVSFKRDDGTQGKRVRLYIIDLDSANGTFLNNKPIEARKYYELFEKDVIKFGFSTREYVLLHENSKEDQEDDDVSIKQEPEGE